MSSGQELRAVATGTLLEGRKHQYEDGINISLRISVLDAKYLRGRHPRWTRTGVSLRSTYTQAKFEGTHEQEENLRCSKSDVDSSRAWGEWTRSGERARRTGEAGVKQASVMNLILCLNAACNQLQRVLQSNWAEAKSGESSVIVTTSAARAAAEKKSEFGPSRLLLLSAIFVVQISYVRMFFTALI
ncbi:hypothetical protein EXIGLDRAFT_803173 [Exidia glandulosa HHB12029]|uniref:Uncharacterized protein n=1 Tax=Exidia glandulosa HHB12029 TaxID=1314781 RepID=A0A165DZ71_EXIGL|nr:hypothetical protein EXIGLDRAFT_803173 [Exidia glandulosa HHB12029]